MDEEKRLLPCRVTILDRTLTYRIEPENESLVRNAVKGISDKLADLKRRHNYLDNQYLLTVALVQYAVDKAQLKAALGALSKDIQQLDAQLDDYIENNVINSLSR